MKAVSILTLIGCASAFAADSLTVNAGLFDRVETVVECKLPPGVSGLSFGNETLPVQHSQDGRSWFILRDLKRGESRTFRFVKANNPVAAVAKEEPGAVSLSVEGKKAFVYRTEKTALPPNRPDLTPIFQRGGYIHPVFTPAGRVVTDDYPVDHKHHHGIWFAWTSTEFEGRKPDFWNVGSGKGDVEFAGLDRIWSGAVHAGFESRHRQVDLTSGKPITALNEQWTAMLFNVGTAKSSPHFLFEITITDTCATPNPVRLPKYRYGGIGVRGPAAWNGKENLVFLNSEGVTDRSKGENNQTVGRWAHLGGLVDGAPAGIAIIGHPGNPNAPQPQRIHPTEPFFNFAPQQAGDLEIRPGVPFTNRYRFVVSDGPADKELLKRLSDDFAHPPEVNF